MKHKLIALTDHELAAERWRDVPDYEGIYQASDMGRVRSAPGKTTHTERHGVRNWKSRILQYKGINSQTGHRVTLWRNGKSKDWLVARLVATTWLGVPADGMTVNHINGNRFDNHIQNLEWITLAGNIAHAFETGLMPTQRPVVLVNESKQPRYFRSLSEASRFLGCNPGYLSNVMKKGKSEINGYRIFVAA